MKLKNTKNAGKSAHRGVLDAFPTATMQKQKILRITNQRSIIGFVIFLLANLTQKLSIFLGCAQ